MKWQNYFKTGIVTTENIKHSLNKLITQKFRELGLHNKYTHKNTLNDGGMHIPLETHSRYKRFKKNEEPMEMDAT